MGRAIVRDPKVFLFDEPLSNLDAKLRVQMRTEIKALHQRLGTTIVYVTHDQVEAMTMADKIVVMNGGIVEQVGAPLDLYDRPANLFVAQFIGSPSMNILQGRTTADGFAASDGTVFPLPVLEQGKRARLGHPARTSQARRQRRAGRGRSGRADRRGNACHGQGRQQHAERAAARTDFRDAGSAGFLAPDLTQLHLFNAKGQRITSTVQ